jgi:hypothetical protein
VGRDQKAAAPLGKRSGSHEGVHGAVQIKLAPAGKQSVSRQARVAGTVPVR